MDTAIRTDRLTLRLPRASDLEPYTAYCASARTEFVGGPYDAVQSFDKLAAMIGHWQLRGFGRFVFADTATGRPIGHVGALQLHRDWPPELTWSIWDSENEGKGYAHEASRAYYEHAAGDLGFPLLLARIIKDNAASIRLAEKLGGVLRPDMPAPPWFPDAITYAFDLDSAT